jgi:hypothetical protein
MKRWYSKLPESANTYPAGSHKQIGGEYHRLTGDNSGSVGLLETEIEAGRVITHEDLRKEFGF